MRIGIISIGINYKGQSGELKGCVNDSKHFIRFAKRRFNGSIGFIIQLNDELPKKHEMYPTKLNIENRIRRAVEMCKRRHCTHFWFHYSGHGTQIKDVSGDEADGKDEALVPVDHSSKGMISDDWLLENMIKKLPKSVRFFGLLDACHSGSILDLRFKIDPVSMTRTIENKSCPSNMFGMMISGCQDDQFSYDSWDKKYGATGAMTVAFLTTMNQYSRNSAAFIVQKMREYLKKKGYPQQPQFSTTFKINKTTRVFGF